MISSISDSGYLGYMSASVGQTSRRTPAGGFEIADSNANGGLSSEELSSLASTISEQTGQEINIEDALADYDENQDGEINGQELLKLLQANSIRPEELSTEEMPPPPPPAEEDEESGLDPLGLLNSSDSDQSGGVSESELNTLVETVEEATGIAVDTTDAISIYDTDEDGELTADELKELLEANGVKPPPPPPPGGSMSEDEEDDEDDIYDPSQISEYSTSLESYLDMFNSSSDNSLLSQLLV